MEGWENFALISGGAAGALIGLLFVAVSIRVDIIAASRDFSGRAGQTLALFTSVLLVAVLLVIPGQSDRELGIELVLTAIVIWAAMILLEREARADATGEGLSELLSHAGTNTVTPALILVTGGLLVFHAERGLYMLVPSVLGAMVSGIITAWLLLVRVGS
jgi:hypothetical protein